jgi:serine/threonine protein kinase
MANLFRNPSGESSQTLIERLARRGFDDSKRWEMIDGLAELLSRQSESGLDSSFSELGSDLSGFTPRFPEDETIRPLVEAGRRFEVVRNHAEGGLGTVSVAIDRELNREVALKQIHGGQADDPARRDRFLIEAEITGGLEHPGVVPVYSLGHSADGRPYYAMRLIRGETLAVAIDRFHDDANSTEERTWSFELRKLLRRFLDICNTIEYAHGRGILHRDLKPSNVMLGKHGETLVVDWGLAKPIGSGSTDEDEEGPLLLSPSSGETLAGSAVGTPSYMSPEQAEGRQSSIGPRSDVYGLGATLYCLLTGQSPFSSKEPGQILQDVREGKFPRPRQLNPQVPHSLEAICLKAMALDPENRYGSARELADDIDRWMADEPISAFREPIAQRVGRWARRRRSMVSSVLAALMVATVALGLVLAVQSKANDELKQTNERANRINDALLKSIRRESKTLRSLEAASPRLPRSKRPGNRGRPSRQGLPPHRRGRISPLRDDQSHLQASTVRLTRVYLSFLVGPCLRPPTPTLPHKGGGSQTQASGCLAVVPSPHCLVPSPLVGEG